MIYFIEYNGRMIVEADDIAEAKEKYLNEDFVIDEKEITYIYDEDNPEFTNEYLEEFITDIS